MNKPTEKEVNEALLQLVETGLVIGLLVDNEVRFIHIEHTDDEMLANKLSLDEIKKEIDKHLP